ncbi:hydrogen gas-evolving membrane-bound hydrogenase subunit E [Pontibacter anaerobius]|uniref:Proton-conducting transporter membrane subunit n=1 Tax=Pontibacter anaerobius TaxID=2993940 RepID=A0ABT3RKN5_9BACT|nr:hydrogen gas-evolving membrane-bound hydrogenase subunit E [Pontibacter anaerobius]MCX2741862.1 proton-conducting transporter membrane subunit [Pontibacter anaerobius]
MLYAIVIGIITATVAPLLHRTMGRFVVIPMALLPLLLFIYFCTFMPEVVGGHAVTQQHVWVPEVGINLQFRLDGLSLIFALLITFFGTLVMYYASGYLDGDPLLGNFYLYLTLFMTAMLGLVMSDNIFSLFIFWELTSISSYLLIGYKQAEKDSRVSAWQALLVTGLGGLALLGGLILLSISAGSYTFSGLLTQRADVLQHAFYVPAVVLTLIGCFTKSAQFPFHFWLPNAMAAPTPVSAYLHSVTMVKAGIYLIARLSPVLAGPDIWHYTLMTVGGITATLGAVLALQHTDLKAILAYTTISALGLMVTMIGIGTDPAMKAMLVFMTAHALYKGTLFLVTGCIDHCTGTRELSKLYRLGSHMKYSGLAASLAALSMAGVIPFIGFIGKELLYEASLSSYVLLAVTMLSGITFVAVAIVFGYRVFWRKGEDKTQLQHHAGFPLYFPPLVLAIGGLALGLLVHLVPTPLLQQGMRAILANPNAELKLSLWHGFTPVLGLSVLTLLLGYAVYKSLTVLHYRASTLKPLYRYGPNTLYHMMFEGFLHHAKAFILWLQDGYLRNYVMYIMFFFCGLLYFILWRDTPGIDFTNRIYQLHEIRLYELVVFFLVIAALIFLLGTRSRLTSIVVMGLVGYSAALFYILFGAPDVAATQLLIETLTVVIFVLLLHKLPAFTYLSHQFQKYKFIAISALFGILMTYVMLLVQQQAMSTSELKEYFGKTSYLEAHGRNIVNVILVDFRGLDTLGEITVLAVAALGIFSLLRLNPERGGKQ